MNHIEKTKKLIIDGKVAIFNPVYLALMPEQHEKSMLGQRTTFLAFHRFLFNLPDMHIYKLWEGYKKSHLEAVKQYPDDVFCDLSLMCDALQYQIATRDDKQGDAMIAEQIAISFHQNAKLARDFDNITSDHLIELANNWLNEK